MESFFVSRQFFFFPDETAQVFFQLTQPDPQKIALPVLFLLLTDPVCFFPASIRFPVQELRRFQPF